MITSTTCLQCEKSNHFAASLLQCSDRLLVILEFMCSSNQIQSNQVRGAAQSFGFNRKKSCFHFQLFFPMIHGLWCMVGANLEVFCSWSNVSSSKRSRREDTPRSNRIFDTHKLAIKVGTIAIDWDGLDIEKKKKKSSCSRIWICHDKLISIEEWCLLVEHAPIWPRERGQLTFISLQSVVMMNEWIELALSVCWSKKKSKRETKLKRNLLGSTCSWNAHAEAYSRTFLEQLWSETTKYERLIETDWRSYIEKKCRIIFLLVC